MVVGRHSGPWTGLRGWIDDLVLLAHDVNPEVACNHAGGSLVALIAPGPLDEVAARYPAWAHDIVAGAAAASSARYACALDHSADYAAHLQAPPAGTTSVREAITFPEGPLRAGVPRPDSSDNPFCLSCHHEDGRGGLTLHALVADPTRVAEDDPRRQPSQPPRRVFGNIPAGWIEPGPGPGGPDQAMVAPAEGLLIDRWVLPGGER